MAELSATAECGPLDYLKKQYIHEVKREIAVNGTACTRVCLLTKSTLRGQTTCRESLELTLAAERGRRRSKASIAFGSQ